MSNLPSFLTCCIEIASEATGSDRHDSEHSEKSNCDVERRQSSLSGRSSNIPSSMTQTGSNIPELLEEHSFYPSSTLDNLYSIATANHPLSPQPRSRSSLPTVFSLPLNEHSTKEERSEEKYVETAEVDNLNIVGKEEKENEGTIEGNVTVKNGSDQDDQISIGERPDSFIETGSATTAPRSKTSKQSNINPQANTTRPKPKVFKPDKFARKILAFFKSDDTKNSQKH